MINIKDISHIYFNGIGGIGMSALARYFHSLNIRVSGYDRTPSALTRELEVAGMDVHYDDDITRAPKDVNAVVFTPAIPADHSELKYYRDNAYPVLKRSDVLQIISEHSFNICVAGTHGKTTISTMIAHILRHTGFGCNAFLGGISANYNTNFWSNERNVCVIEADEYDRSFLKLSPDIAVISAMDPDHLDIYGTAGEMEDAYIRFVRKIRLGGLLVSKKGLKRESELVADKQISYGLNDQTADAYTENLKVVDGAYGFDLVLKGEQMEGLVLNVGGLHNVENMIAAITVALHLGIDGEKLRTAVASFKGVKRRFEYIVKSELVYIDDYAHHPEELRSLITSVKMLYPNRKTVVVFQPHLFSRTRDLAEGFADALDIADEVMLLPIYPARELPVEGVTSRLISDGMRHCETGHKVRLVQKEDVLKWVGEHREDMKKMVLVTAGAGDIDRMIEPIKKTLTV
jgi:UDP-N-acetylmuramate--alanine ligase